MSTLKQVQALHIVVKKQPWRNRLVSTTADLFVDFLFPSFMLEITDSNGKIRLCELRPPLMLDGAGVRVGVTY